MKPELITNPSDKRAIPISRPQSPTVCNILKEKEYKEIESVQGHCKSIVEEEEEVILNYSSPKENKSVYNFDSDLNNKSTLDPETGLLLDTSFNTETSSSSTLPTSSSSKSSEQLTVLSESTVAINPHYTNTIQYVPKQTQTLSTQISLRHSVIQGNSSTVDSYNVAGKDSSVESDTEENGKLHQIYSLL
jgi:hypothetical protein